jgi:hypothetical protein
VSNRSKQTDLNGAINPRTAIPVIGGLIKIFAVLTLLRLHQRNRIVEETTSLSSHAQSLEPIAAERWRLPIWIRRLFVWRSIVWKSDDAVLKPCEFMLDIMDVIILSL